MHALTKDEIATILAAHDKWCRREIGGKRADLSDANLSDANLYGANLSDVRAVVDAGWPNGWRTVGWIGLNGVQVRVGCKSLSLAEGRDYWRGKSNRREVVAALDYIETTFKIREMI